jgi:hypothetical protein
VVAVSLFIRGLSIPLIFAAVNRNYLLAASLT